MRSISPSPRLYAVYDYATDCLIDWIHGAEIADSADNVSKLGEDNDRQKVPADYPTLQKQSQGAVQCQDVSPTNTSFSNNSVFDTGQAGQHCTESPGSATEVDDTLSESTSIGRNKTISSGNARSPAKIKPKDEPDDVFTSHPAIPSLEPRQPRLVFITSCLQCTLADLPCSRTLPACTRCQRNGYGEVCLLHRRQFPEEIVGASIEEYNTPKLLKLHDEDNETWTKKIATYCALLEKWQEQQERKNWTMPSIHSPRKNWSAFHLNGEKRHPGEGQGKVEEKAVYRTLRIAQDG